MPALYGIIGYPLTHSFSPAYFSRKFASEGIDAVYESFPNTDIAELDALIAAHPNLRGLSVTIPYKQSVIPRLDELDAVAAAVGAVNCIAITGHGKKGCNTDVEGFEQSLVPLLQPQHTHALVLGTGGASRAVIYVLQKLGIVCQRVSRNSGASRIAYENLTPASISEHKLIINTTPLGMYPQTDAAPPIPYEAITGDHLLYDLIYNPEETLFLKRGREAGAAIKNGLDMLHLQAEAAWKIWNEESR